MKLAHYHIWFVAKIQMLLMKTRQRMAKPGFYLQADEYDTNDVIRRTGYHSLHEQYDDIQNITS